MIACYDKIVRNLEDRIDGIETKLNTLMEEIKELKENKKNNMAFKLKSELKRKRVEENEDYYYIDDGYKLNGSSEWNDETDRNRFMYHNYFVNEKDAEKYLRVLNTEAKLRQLAEELNNGKEINWKNDNQDKYYLYYDYMENEVWEASKLMQKWLKLYIV